MAFFEGNNFGSTYQGVSGSEVRILIYSGFSASQAHPPGTYVDLQEPPTQGEGETIRILRNWQRYFNDRFQTYGRFVHFYVYVPTNSRDAESIRAQAADNWSKIRPFAAFAATRANQEHYLDAMASKRVMAFSSLSNRLSADLFRRHAGFAWSYDPTVDYYAENLASYICSKVINRPVSFSGNPQDMGQTRRLGLFHTSDTDNANVVAAWRSVKREVERCGGNFVDEKTYPRENSTEDTGNRDPNKSAARANAEGMASFQQNRVTTVVWPGMNIGATQAAAGISYRPEWIWIGVSGYEGNIWSKLQDQSVWRYSWLLTDSVREESGFKGTHCWHAYREVAGEQSELENEGGATDGFIACSELYSLYPHLLQLFTGIQVSGPRLTPANVEKGYRAIPPKESSDPFMPACFYLAADYSCVKDAMVEWWDPSGSTGGYSGSGSQPDALSKPAGCWRTPELGLRHVRDGWPAGDPTAQKRMDDPCNTMEG